MSLVSEMSLYDRFQSLCTNLNGGPLHNPQQCFLEPFDYKMFLQNSEEIQKRQERS